MRVKWFLVRLLWRSIRRRRACIYWLLSRKTKQIKPLSSKKGDGLRASFYLVDEWAYVDALKNYDILRAAASRGGEVRGHENL